jgi:hypothetical protein
MGIFSKIFKKTFSNSKSLGIFPYRVLAILPPPPPSRPIPRSEKYPAQHTKNLLEQFLRDLVCYHRKKTGNNSMPPILYAMQANTSS